MSFYSFLLNISRILHNFLINISGILLLPLRKYIPLEDNNGFLKQIFLILAERSDVPPHLQMPLK